MEMDINSRQFVSFASPVKQFATITAHFVSTRLGEGSAQRGKRNAIRRNHKF